LVPTKMGFSVPQLQPLCREKMVLAHGPPTLTTPALQACRGGYYATGSQVKVPGFALLCVVLFGAGSAGVQGVAAQKKVSDRYHRHSWCYRDPSAWH